MRSVLSSDPSKPEYDGEYCPFLKWRELQCGDRGMQFGVRGAGLAMHRPSVDVIGIVRPVRSWFDMPVLCGGDVRVFAAMRSNILRDAFGDGIAALHTQFPAFAERRLHVHDDQRLAHGRLLLGFTMLPWPA